MPTIDKAALFAPRLPEEDHDIPDLGTVRIRSLSRAEVLAIRGKSLPVDEMERRLLSSALVSPRLTEAEVGQWQEASAAGELEPVTKAIMRLSGLEEASAKEAVARFPG
ncbi:hypothetical protein [Pseudonocardia hydrocarbonoxydans]|uniref:Uncharacterized protein n=1 Tax=Pseudonocardia hydrocarbonoxydans TaxID=76726 RepID=A0A4Y3WSA6_9PSEU|nr:hypothetical protein [Pseudonocardia hydrocarbonoxydans]GEC20980.1 hypothetical protein PHY01_32630 [Pseudonocardia hydrocarbonoxydans]